MTTNKLIQKEVQHVIKQRLSDRQARYLLMYVFGSLEATTFSHDETTQNEVDKTIAERIRTAMLAAMNSENFTDNKQ